MKRFIHTNSLAKDRFRLGKTGLLVLIMVMGIVLFSAKSKSAAPSANDPAINTADTRDTRSGNVHRHGVQVEVDKPHTLAATFYSAREGLKTTLTLNNKGPLPLEVKPTLYNRAGERLDITPVTVPANAFSVIDLREWAAMGGETFAEGSLQLFYRGNDLRLGAQVKMMDEAARLMFDEQLVEPAMMFKSSRLEGVCALPVKQCQVEVCLSNTTDAPLTVTVTVKGAPSLQSLPSPITLQAHETKRELLAARAGGELPDVIGVSVAHQGQPGALLARGMIQEPTRGYSSVIQFVDPATLRSAELEGTGLRLGKIGGDEFRPVTVARNIGDGPVVISGKLLYTAIGGGMGFLPIAKVRLQAGEARVLPLQPALQRLDPEVIATAGLQFQYQGQPGSIIMSALSVSGNGDQVCHVPMLDPGAQKSSTGGYPWFIEGDSSTVVYVMNTTDRLQHYAAYLKVAGNDYVIGTKALDPGQTASYDIRAMRDSQTADRDGHTIPLDANSGQFYWSIIQDEGEETQRYMIGRAEQMDREKGMSSSYACQNCCSTQVADYYVSPAYVEISATGQVALYARQNNYDCNGNIYPSDPYSVNWSSSNGTVASVNGGTVTAKKGGEVTITAQWFAYTTSPPLETCGGPYGAQQPNLPNPCACTNNSVRLTARATIRVIPRVIISGAQTVMDGSPATFNIQSPDATPTSITWSFMAPTGAGNNPNVTFNPNGNTNTTATGGWFALPDRDCPNTNCNSTYTILCQVTFSLGFNISLAQSTTLTVNGCWFPAGQVDPNQARIIGVPAMAPDVSGTWRITGMGTLARRLPTKQVFVAAASQFFNKTNAHEDEHMRHWNPGNLFGNVHQPADFYARIQNFTGTSQQDLIDKLGAELTRYTNEQDAFVGNNIRESERRAYQVSDPLAPRYLYQNCGRY